MWRDIPNVSHDLSLVRSHRRNLGTRMTIQGGHLGAHLSDNILVSLGVSKAAARCRGLRFSAKLARSSRT